MTRRAMLSKLRKRLKMRQTMWDDLPALRRLHAEQNRRHGTNYPLSPAEDLALALTVIDQTNKVRCGIVFEKVGVEMMFIGCDPKATAIAQQEIAAVCWTLRQLGYKYINCGVPTQRLKMVGPQLEAAGFTRQDKKVARFFKDLTEVES